MQHPIRSENTPPNRPLPWWMRGRQLSIRFPTPGDPPEPPSHSPGVIVPKALHSVYADVLGVPALLDTLPDPTPDASDRAAVHPEAANEREGRNHG